MAAKTRLWLALALVAGVVVAYLPALRAGFIWNDDTYLTENPTLDAPQALRLIWTEPGASEQYYPMVFTSFWLEKQIWGLHPLGYHLVNVLLHAASALLLWRLLRRLDLSGAWIAAAAFALHPVCVESVAWVTERKNVLALFLSLLSAHALLSWRGHRTVTREQKGRRRDGREVPWHRRPAVLYLAALAAFTLALAAKTTASLLPAAFLVIVWWREGRLRSEDIRPMVPFFLVGATLALHTAWLEQTMVKASGQEWALGLPGRLVLAGRVVLFYAWKLVWPVDLAFIYPRWVIQKGSWWQWTPVLGLVLLVGSLWWLRERVGRGPLAATLLFGGLLFPAMGFFNVYPMRYSYVADHFQYMAAAAGISALVCGLAGWVRARPASVRRGVAVVSGLVLVALGGVSFGQAGAYRDDETLWRRTLGTNPDCFMCHNNLGMSLYERGRVDEAVDHFQQSLRVKPDNVQALLNLTRVEDEAGRLDEAITYCRRAVDVDPTSTASLLNLGTLLVRTGRAAEAIPWLEEALRQPSPDAYLVENGLGVACMHLGRIEEAVRHFQAAVHLNPEYWKAQSNLENARRRLPSPG